jgi:probable glucitol transport protein GutA
MDFKTNKRERIGYFLFCLGFPVFNNFVGGYVSLFMTDSGIAAAVVAVILGVAQIWDGINDPAFGTLVDLKPFPSGKYKPWTRLAPIVMPALTMILFALPLGMSTGWKIAWAALFYILYTTAYDIGDVPIFGVIGVMTDDIRERNFLTGRRNLAGVIIIAVVTVVAPPLYSSIGWAPTAVIMSLLGGLLMWPFHKVLVERIEPAAEEKITIRRMFGAVLKNKYLLIFYLAVVICEFTNTTQSILPYCARYLLGSDSYTTVLYILVLFPILFFAIFMPQLCARIDKFVLLYISVAGCFVTSIISYFVGYDSVIAVCVMMFIRGIFFGPLTILLYVFTVDIIEYGHFRNGERVEGLAFSFQTFCAKAASGVTSTVMMLVLSAFHFVEGAVLDQPASAYSGIWLLFTLIPAIGYGLSLIAFAFYRLRDKDVQIMTEANVGSISREEALERLGERYS